MLIGHGFTFVAAFVDGCTGHEEHAYINEANEKYYDISSIISDDPGISSWMDKDINNLLNDIRSLKELYSRCLAAIAPMGYIRELTSAESSL